MPNFFVDICKDLVYESGWPSRPIWPIYLVKQATKRADPPFRWLSYAIAKTFLGDNYSDVKNSKICGRPFQVQPVGPQGESDLFSSSNNPQECIPLISTIFMCYTKPFFGLSWFRRQKWQHFLWTSINNMDILLNCPHRQLDKFSRSNKLRSAHTPYFNYFRVV